MKIALMTANIGGIDDVYPPAKQTQPYELFYYTENTLPFQLPNLDNRMKGKYFKTQAHKFLDHELFIWIDGSIEITDGHFITWILEHLQDHDIVISKHDERLNVYDELNHIINKMKIGSPYLLKRYFKQPFKAELDFYKSQKLPKDFPLYKCNFFARWNNNFINEVFDIWWDITLRYTNFDQAAFSYAAWKTNCKIKDIDTSGNLIRYKHQ